MVKKRSNPRPAQVHTIPYMSDVEIIEIVLHGHDKLERHGKSEMSVPGPMAIYFSRKVADRKVSYCHANLRAPSAVFDSQTKRQAKPNLVLHNDMTMTGIRQQPGQWRLSRDNDQND